MDLLQIAGCRHESQVRIIQRDGSRADSVSGIPKNGKTPRIESVFGGFEFRALLFREWGASNHLASTAAATRFIAHESGSTREEGGLKVNAVRQGGSPLQKRRDDLIAIKGNCRKSDQRGRD